MLIRHVQREVQASGFLNVAISAILGPISHVLNNLFIAFELGLTTKLMHLLRENVEYMHGFVFIYNETISQLN